MYFDYTRYKQKGFAQFLLILFVLVLIFAGVGVYFVSKGKNSLQSPGFIITKQPAFIDYNSPLGFQLKYSKDLVVKQDSEAEFNKRGNGDFRKNFTGYVGYEPGKFLGAAAVLDKTGSFEINSISIWVFDNPDNISSDSWFAEYWYYPYVWGVFDWTSKGHITPDTEATISGQLAKYKIVSYQPGSPKFLYISFDSKMYLLRIIGSEGEKILSTFKFQ